MTKKTYNIALFFTFGTNLQIWKDSGLFSREVKPYLELSKLGHEITFYTYGDQNDLKFQDELGCIRVKPLLNSKILKQSKIISMI